ncbi:MAG: hypothetical protein K8T20_03250 [Planctomycetes bacterium]|nr:hypothetical protein [Planctomycetota bacterium]
MKRFVAATILLGGAAVGIATFSASPAWSAPPASYSFDQLDKLERQSIASSLGWLARHQEADGSWKASGGPGHGFEALYEPDAAKSCDVMATSLALLAFVGDGNSPWMGPYQETVTRAWQWLLAQQAATKCGALVPVGEESEGASLSDREKAAKRGHIARMNHLWGTLALLEVVGSAVFDDKLTPIKDADKIKRRLASLPGAEAALKYVTDDPLTKPARFDFLNEKTINMDELSLLGALRYVFGKQGVMGDKDWFGGVKDAIKHVQEGQTEALVAYRYSEDGEYWFRGSISTPQCMIAYVYTFNNGSAAQMKAAAPSLLAHPPVWNPYYEIGRPSRHPEAGTAGAPKPVTVELPDALKGVAGKWSDDIANECSWFWQAMTFRSFAAVSPDVWNKWRSSIVPLLNEHQRRSGPEAGSWDPMGPHAKVFGREVATAWNCITLQSRCLLQVSRSNWQDLKEDPRWRSRKEMLDNAPVEKVKCTVCEMEILSNGPFSKGEGSTIYHFCTEEHMQIFELNPVPYRNGEHPPIDGSGHGGHK